MRKVIGVFAVLLSALMFAGRVAGQAAKAPQPAEAQAQKTPCAPDLAHCADTGCSDTPFDPNLNRQKNIVSNAATTGPAVIKTLAQMKAMGNPKHFVEGGPRTELQTPPFEEGKKISVVAFIIAAKAELGGESCNCNLQTPAETDNHLVLVSPETLTTFPLPGNVFHNRELQSITAEFTPRVRKAGHPNFTKETMDPLINATAQQALLVRVTGLLLFDSEHFIRHPLVRVNNWEIHPVLGMEFCTTGTNCTADSNKGWKSIDNQN